MVKLFLRFFYSPAVILVLFLSAKVSVAKAGYLPLPDEAAIQVSLNKADPMLLQNKVGFRVFQNAANLRGSQNEARFQSLPEEAGFQVSLNGSWEMGAARKYSAVVTVPGIPADPTKMSRERLWYRKELKLPAGSWQYATLELKGARFLPEVYVNGRMVSKQNGGMAPTFHLLNSTAVRPGNKIILEIALASLKEVPEEDASFIPQADQWRSNISSGLWDDVVLHLHGSWRIGRIIPFINYIGQEVSVHYDLESLGDEKPEGTVFLEILDATGKSLISKEQSFTGLHDSVKIGYKDILKPWSPDNPQLYQLRLAVKSRENKVSDSRNIPFGIKDFGIREKQFYLNGAPCKLRGGTVVWHRWMRTPEGRQLGFDTAWFSRNIIRRLKDHGANYLRFHLGKPPERLLDLCDKYGLLVQYEWSFFHGMPASRESLLEQYKSWLDVAMRHPSVVLVHPYNETEGEQLQTVWSALDVLLKSYPPLVLEERDVIHVHKYWWSLFENLGLYYDSATQFPKAIMVDEFGGNYLDAEGNLGGYKALRESYLRFLGRDHNAGERLAFHAMANTKVAEYWRRIDAAGFAPFCALGSFEDGNSWFLGKLKEGRGMPVWKELTAAFSPLSVSMDIWDRNFTPGEELDLPVYFFNDTKSRELLNARVRLTDSSKNTYIDTTINANLAMFSKAITVLPLSLPEREGRYKLSVELLNKQVAVKYPVVSDWDIHIYKAKSPLAGKDIKIAVPEDELELKAFFEKQSIKITSPDDKKASVILASLTTWKKIAKGDQHTINLLERAVDNNVSVILLDVGERDLGQGYPKHTGDLGPLQGVAKVSAPKVSSYALFKGISLTFTQAAEPESHLHADRSDSSLWKNIPKDYTWLWNGMRGGLIVPAADMEITGLSPAAFLEQWKARGADERAIRQGAYYAYELQGFYGFSSKPDDKDIRKELVDKVTFLAQDAPSLVNSLNPASPVEITDLGKACKLSQSGQARGFTILANCGKNLTRTPVALIDFGKGKGRMIVSQLLTSGRLAAGYGGEGIYGIRYDEVAVQMVLNMIGKVFE